MNPVRLRLEGFRSYGDLDLSIPLGCVGIIGPNGAGKSTLVTAIEVALFGTKGRSLLPQLNPTRDSMLVELTFDHGSSTYRVRRGFKSRKATLDLAVATNGIGRGDGGTMDEVHSWQALTGPTVSDTQADIEQLLGLTRETYRASSYLAQGDGGAFTEADPRDRKRILGEVLGLDAWNEWHVKAGTDRRQLEAELAVVHSKIEMRAEQANSVVERERDVKALALESLACEEDAAADVVEMERIQRAVETDKQLETQHTVRQAALTAAAGRLNAHAGLAARLDAAVAQRPPLLEEIARLESEAAGEDEARAAIKEADDAVADRKAALQLHDFYKGQIAYHDNQAVSENSQVTELEVDAGNLELGEQKVCDRCGTELEGDARARAVASMRAEATEHRAKRDQWLSERAKVAAERERVVVPDEPDPEAVASMRGNLAAIVAASAKLATARAQLAVLDKEISDTDTAEFQEQLHRLQAEHTAAAAAVSDLEPFNQDQHDEMLISLEAAVARRVTFNQHLIRLSGLRERAQLAFEHAQEAADQIGVLTSEKERLAHELALTETLERSFGRDGVPAFIVENAAIPAIEAEASRILTELGGPVSHVELRTQRETQSGALSDTLDVVCILERGERDYRDLSGGERTRVDIALRVGLARLLARRRGADTRLLAIDEPDGLDTEGMTRLARILRGMSDDFDRVLLVSHQPQLREAFDQLLVVNRDGDNHSTVEAI